MKTIIKETLTAFTVIGGIGFWFVACTMIGLAIYNISIENKPDVPKQSKGNSRVYAESNAADEINTTIGTSSTDNSPISTYAFATDVDGTPDFLVTVSDVGSDQNLVVTIRSENRTVETIGDYMVITVKKN